ncbi:5-oxoproline transporter, DUF969 family subunit [Yersinia enterocolitica]
MMLLIGLAVLIFGFALRFNPLLVITAAGITPSIFYGVDISELISEIGKSFSNSRYMGLVWLSLPLVAMLEKQGLRIEVRNLVKRIKSASVGRVLFLYLLIRQFTTAIGLASLGGQAQIVRPILVPMLEFLSSRSGKELDDDIKDTLRAKAASVDNVGAFFGECLFIGMPAILLIKSFLANYAVYLDPFNIIIWAIPTGIVSLFIHGYRMLSIDKKFRFLDIDKENKNV